MWFGALAPAVSHALVAAGSATWVQVCTPQGMRWVSGAEDPAAQPDQPNGTAAGLLDHCPYCTLSHQGAAPPPAATGLVLLPFESVGPPKRFLSAARTAHVWCAALPRAPPSHS